jgi:D-glycero-D-manno-heptose 1,7-bisphosphate phosphatase
MVPEDSPCGLSAFQGELTRALLLAGVFQCLYHPEFGVGHYRKDSFDRKPNPGMLLRDAKKHGLDLGHSIMIGDKDSDMQAASKERVERLLSG